MSSNVQSEDSGDNRVSPVRYEIAPGEAEPLFLSQYVCQEVYFADGEPGNWVSAVLSFRYGGDTQEQADGRKGAPEPVYVIEDHRAPGDNRVLYVWPNETDRGDVFMWVFRRVEAIESETGRKTTNDMSDLWRGLELT